MYAHTLHLNCQLDYCAMRFSNVYGPGSTRKTSVVAQMIKDALDKDQINIYGTGKQTRDFIYIDDVCRGILTLASSITKGVINIHSGQLASINSVAEIIQGITKVKVKRHQSRAGDIDHPSLSYDSLQERSHWRASMDLEEGIKQTYEWYLRWYK